MHWEIILALVLVVPIIMIPVVFVFYLNAGKLISAVALFKSRVKSRRAAPETVVEDATLSLMTVRRGGKERCRT